MTQRTVPDRMQDVRRRSRRLAVLAGFLLAGLADSAAKAAPAFHTSAIAFFASLPGGALTADFETLPSGEIIASGAAVEGLVVDHDLGGVDLIVTDGTAAGGSGPFATTSGSRFLGSGDLDLLVDGDDLDFHFGAAHAVGLFVITAETPGTSLFDGDVRLQVGGAAVSLDVDDVQSTLADGSRVFFLGLIDPEASFTSASLRTFGAGGEFAFNVDDVITALPEPAPESALAVALLGSVGALGRQRRSRR
ncbi:MAG: hypothetical protein R3F35_12700 [Myxococcota bacterium]